MSVKSATMRKIVPRHGIRRISGLTSTTPVTYQNGHLKSGHTFSGKNISGFSSKSPLNQITALYRPVKSGDLYSIGYQMQNQKLDLVLNNKPLGSITDPHANDYFKIWFGAAPFNAKLKQQLLN